MSMARDLRKNALLLVVGLTLLPAAECGFGRSTDKALRGEPCEHVPIRMVGFGENTTAPLKPDSVVAIVGYTRYVVEASGVGYRRRGDGDEGVFRLVLRDDAFLDRAYLLIHRCNPIFAIEDGDGVSGSSRVTAIDGGTLDPIWTSESLGLNLGPAALAGETLYLTTAGAIAALDLTTGRFRWNHDGLPSSSYETPLVSDTGVYFLGLGGDTVVVDAVTGRLNSRR